MLTSSGELGPGSFFGEGDGCSVASACVVCHTDLLCVVWSFMGTVGQIGFLLASMAARLRRNDATSCWAHRPKAPSDVMASQI